MLLLATQVTTLLGRQEGATQAAAAALPAAELQQLRDQVAAQGTAVKDAKAVSSCPSGWYTVSDHQHCIC